MYTEGCKCSLTEGRRFPSARFLDMWASRVMRKHLSRILLDDKLAQTASIVFFLEKHQPPYKDFSGYIEFLSLHTCNCFLTSLHSLGVLGDLDAAVWVETSLSHLMRLLPSPPSFFPKFTLGDKCAIPGCAQRWQGKGALGSSLLGRRSLKTRWYESWGGVGWGVGDNEMTGVGGLEGASIELLWTQI